MLFETRDIVKTYAAHTALNKVSIKVPEKSIFGLLGPNGAGKTSLIRIINQITGPDSGELFFNGKKLQPSDVQRIGYLPEERGLYKKMKVGEQAIYLAQLKGLAASEAKKELMIWFEKFDIADWWHKKVEDLSKGMAQKIQFIVTIIHKPELLIFDEPFSGFDPINVNILKKEILKLRNEGTTIIFSTHNMASVEEVCDHIALINKAEKVLEGKMLEIKERFKEHLYEFVFEGDEEALTNELSEKVAIEESRGEKANLTVKVKLPSGFDSNELLKIIIKHGILHAFSEVLPSMNDIFIQMVESQKQAP
jgi:ABC-2 type transport system ATP-binding protein